MMVLKLSLFICLLASIYCSSLRQSEDVKAELAEFIEQARGEINQRYRLTYHIAAPVGWVNDPNGFSFYKGQYHLFYQYYPYAAIHGAMHWGHVVSSDLVNWDELPTALIPENEECFSGSAVVDGDNLVLIYTAHEVAEKDPFYEQSQFLAISDNGVDFSKYEGNPVIPAPNGTADFRDPKAWRHGDWWYVIIGSKTSDERGRVLLYRSEDLISWEFLTVLSDANEDLGFMWECPDFFELDGKHVLLMSPQGMKPQGDRYKNTHQVGYIVGHFDYETFQFTPETDFQEIDFGHDFYAAQTTEHNGRRLLVAWFAMWDVPIQEDVDGWSGALTMIRELRLDSSHHILMTPVDEMLQLRESSSIDGDFEPDQEANFGSAAEILIQADFEQNIDLLLEGHAGGGKVWLRWDPDVAKVVVQRGEDDIRQMEWVPQDDKGWRIFLDTSSLELFCGEGEVVFSSRVYPLGGWKLINQSPQAVKITAYPLKRSVPV